MWPPALLSSRPPVQRILIPLVSASLAGALGGVLLGVSEAGYVTWTTVMILGGIGAGMEHDTPRGGALRGLAGGAVFAAAILGIHELIGNDAKASLPDPASLLIAIFAVISLVLGLLGARLRRRFAGGGGSQRAP